MCVGTVRLKVVDDEEGEEEKRVGTQLEDPLSIGAISCCSAQLRLPLQLRSVYF
jgi:hypothetical protein